MKKKLFLFFAIQILLLSGLLFSSPDSKMEKDLTLSEDQTYAHSILSFKGKLDIKGNVKESIFLVGGRLNLDGVVEEDVICIASKVAIGKNALIKRDLFVIGGTMERDPDAKVQGELFYVKFDLKKIENTLIPILSDARTVSFLKAIRIIVWFIIALIVFMVVPKRVNTAEEILDKYRMKIGTVGLLSLFAFIFMAFIFIILSFVIVGIPLLILLLLIYFVIYVFGRTVMFYYIGIKLSQLLKLKSIPPAVFLVIGVVFYALMKFLPILGAVVLIILNIFELGIGVSYFFRKKFKFE